MSAQLVHGVCDQCDDPVAVGPFGWYRCRSCGFESLRSLLADEAKVRAERGAAAPALGLSLSPSKTTCHE